jgi:hypothetical protein
MNTVTGIFPHEAAARRGLEHLRALGIPESRITLLAPGAPTRQLDAVPTEDAEPPGTGAAIGGVVGAAVGAAGAIPVGAVVSLLVPGVGPVIAAGMLAAALGAAGGVAVGKSLESALSEGLPKDELFFYEEALRRGRAVVIAQVEDDAEAEGVRAALAERGAESLDAARESWWIGLRSVEERSYRAAGRDFGRDEAEFRRGFEAALGHDLRGRTYGDALGELRRRYPGSVEEPAFRAGFERGQEYLRAVSELQGPARKIA